MASRSATSAGYSGRTVPEHTFALMLALRRSIVPFRADVLAGEWRKADQFCFFNHPIHDLGGARLEIIGEGFIGQRVADIARVLGMTPMFAAHKGKTELGPLYTPWNEVLETADVITLHCPLTPETANVIGLPEFRQMKRRPLIINTARGGLIDEKALEIALEEGLISGAGVDVTIPEPPPAELAAHAHRQPPQCHRNPAHRLGERRGPADAGRPIDRQHRGFRGREAEKPGRGSVLTPEKCVRACSGCAIAFAQPGAPRCDAQAAGDRRTRCCWPRTFC